MKLIYGLLPLFVNGLPFSNSETNATVAAGSHQGHETMVSSTNQPMVSNATEIGTTPIPDLTTSNATTIAPVSTIRDTTTKKPNRTTSATTPTTTNATTTTITTTTTENPGVIQRRRLAKKIEEDASMLISNYKKMKLVRGDFSTVLAEIKQPCGDFVSYGYLLPASDESTVHNFGQRYTGVQPSLFRNYDYLAEKYLKIAGHELDSDLKKQLADEFEQMFNDWIVELGETEGENVKMAFYTGNLQDCTEYTCNYSFGMVEVEATVDMEFNLEMNGINFEGAPRYETDLEELYMISMLLARAQTEFRGDGYVTDFAVDPECSKYNFIPNVVEKEEKEEDDEEEDKAITVDEGFEEEAQKQTVENPKKENITNTQVESEERKSKRKGNGNETWNMDECVGNFSTLTFKDLQQKIEKNEIQIRDREKKFQNAKPKSQNANNLRNRINMNEAKIICLKKVQQKLNKTKHIA